MELLYFRRPNWNWVPKGTGERWEQKTKWHISLKREPRKRRWYRAICNYEYDASYDSMLLRDKITNPKILCSKCAQALAKLEATEKAAEETIQDINRQFVNLQLIREAAASINLDRDQTIDLGPQTGESSGEED